MHSEENQQKRLSCKCILVIWCGKLKFTRYFNWIVWIGITKWPWFHKLGTLNISHIRIDQPSEFLLFSIHGWHRILWSKWFCCVQINFTISVWAIGRRSKRNEADLSFSCALSHLHLQGRTACAYFDYYIFNEIFASSLLKSSIHANPPTFTATNLHHYNWNNQIWGKYYWNPTKATLRSAVYHHET